MRVREENAKEDRLWENTLVRDQPQRQRMKFPPGEFLALTSLQEKLEPREAGEGGTGDKALPAQKHQQVAPNKAKGASREIDSQEHMCLKGITQSF